MKKGFVHLIPAVVVAIVLSLGTIGLAGSIRTKAIDNSKVLSSSTENKGQGSLKSQSSENSQNKEEGKSQEKTKDVEGKSAKSKLKEVKVKETEVKLEVEDENEATHEASPSTTPGKKIRTNFPITVNPLTNEKIVTTPGGIKVIILPEVAIQNMIKAGFPVVLPPEPSPSPSGEATPSATPEGTPSATPQTSGLVTTDESAILLTELNNQLVYEIPATQEQKFLGLVKVKIKVKGYVSAENGSIVTIQKSLFDNILDFLSTNSG